MTGIYHLCKWVSSVNGSPVVTLVDVKTLISSVSERSDAKVTQHGVRLKWLGPSSLIQPFIADDSKPLHIEFCFAKSRGAGPYQWVSVCVARPEGPIQLTVTQQLGALTQLTAALKMRKARRIGKAEVHQDHGDRGEQDAEAELAETNVGVTDRALFRIR